MSPSELERIVAFEDRFGRAQASEVIELGWGHLVLQHAFPSSHTHNRVVVTSAVPGDELVATTDELMGDAGRDHRAIYVLDEAVGRTLAAELADARYEHVALNAMIDRAPAPVGSDESVRPVTVAERRDATMRDWRGELPDASDDAIAQLADRAQLYSQGAEATLLASFDGDEIAARADVFIDRDIAQFESLFTHPDYRGRGHAARLVHAAKRQIQAAGCAISYLVADLDDWPRAWYERLGYESVGETHEFTRL